MLPNGKVDRRALPPPDRTVHKDDYRTARTPVEEVLCGIWEQVLGREGVLCGGRLLRFGRPFAAGNAIDVARAAVVSDRCSFAAAVRASDACQAGPGCRSGNASRTRAAAASVVDWMHGSNAPLSFAQQRLWILDKLEPSSATYNLPSALRMEGLLNVAALEQSFNEIIRRHEVLRTTFAIIDGEPAQFTSPPVPIDLSFIDLSQLPEAESEARRLARAEAEKPFDLTRGPLLRAALAQLSDDLSRVTGDVAPHRCRWLVGNADGAGVGRVVRGLQSWGEVAAAGA